ncbi:MAG TPA: DNA-3-methyladenine glycosylase [Candidatus Binataceae bacterium]|nr:DNA-3-methyladenine glycosylase [Candidatus Binataceae bacterium]
MDERAQIGALRAGLLLQWRVLSTKFFQVDPLECAANLIGTRLVWGECAGIVVETEAYMVEGDEACHTFSRPSTREFVRRNKPGTAYVYFNYGVHWMLNVLVKGGPRDGIILIRALEPRRGIALMRERRGVADLRRLCAGPGRLTQALDIAKRHHELDLCAQRAHSFRARPNDNVEVVADARIGISRAKAFPWRFTLRGSEFVSVPVRSPVLSSRAGGARRETSQPQRALSRPLSRRLQR